MWTFTLIDVSFLCLQARFCPTLVTYGAAYGRSGSSPAREHIKMDIIKPHPSLFKINIKFCLEIKHCQEWSFTSSSSAWELFRCRGWDKSRNGRLTTKYPTTVAKSGTRENNLFIFYCHCSCICYLGKIIKLPLTLGDNAIHHTHGETEEDEIVQMIDLQTNSVQLTNSNNKRLTMPCKP